MLNMIKNTKLDVKKLLVEKHNLRVKNLKEGIFYSSKSFF